MKLEADKINPVGKRVLLSVFEGSTKTESGLDLADSSGGATPVLGTVIKTGSDSSYKENDVVFFRRFAIDEIKVDASDDRMKFYFLEESEIIGTYEGEVETPEKPDDPRLGNYEQVTYRKNELQEKEDESVSEGEVRENGNEGQKERQQ